MTNFQGIRERQRRLVEILETKAFKESGFAGLRTSTLETLQSDIAFCAAYERAKRPFNHDVRGN